MPKIPKSREIVRILNKLGFYYLRQSGSHAIYENEITKVQAVIPVHGGQELSIGVFKKILRDLGLNVEEFWRLK